MKNRTNPLMFLSAILVVAWMFSAGCKKEDDNSDPAPPAGTVTDIDGNVYHTVTIGTQVWMVENLRTTRYNDGAAIPLVTDGASWSALTSAGFCWFNNDAAKYKNTYGALYNWHAVNPGKLAPAGWHVPTDAEWTMLTDHLGGAVTAGGKMKSTGTIEGGTGLWYSPNAGATNESGFTAVPAGERDGSGTFNPIGFYGTCWTATESFAGYAWQRRMFYDGASASSYYSTMNYGFSVRCVRDLPVQKSNIKVL